MFTNEYNLYIRDRIIILQIKHFKPVIKMKYLFLLFLINVLNLAQVKTHYNFEKTESEFELKQIIKNDLNVAVDDFFEFTSKASIDQSNDVLRYAFVLGTVGFFIPQDESIRYKVSKNHTKTMNSISDIAELYGTDESAMLCPVLFYTAGYFTENDELRKTGRLLFESLFISKTIVQFMKMAFGRTRPYLQKGAYEFSPMQFTNPFNSFPSGHTVIAFTISSVLAARLDNSLASIGLFSLAGLTAYQRIYSDNHWFSDTAMSAIIGFAVGNTIANLGENGNEGNNISLIPYSDFNSTGFNLLIHF
ncbi:MAG: hypothetical protein CVV23_07325 [Ignavibacteriae bacterium HGW-Ignavibacteriae-2]|nr:MAG: hypothetical protein CVV23_07325 [Ignavibacteriae bacterium HGW-Ignavibacteriae-2]